MLKPRVFVSSVMDGFGEYRAAARAGIEAAGCEPVLIDDNPALSISPRNACLDGVESCDAVAVIVGGRGGWTAPSGKLVVEEEYDHARGRSIPTLVFLQNTERDAAGEQFAAKLSEFVSGNFRRTFTLPADLRREVESACRSVVASGGKTNVDRGRFDQLLANPHAFGREAVLRIVIATGRPDETVISTEQLDSEEFRHTFIAAGVARDVGLFHRNRRRVESRARNSVVVLHDESRGSPPVGDAVRVELTEDGWLVIDVNVTGIPENSRHDLMADLGMSPVEVEAIREHATRALCLARRVFEDIDPHHRHVGLACNASLGSLNGRVVAFHRDREKYMGQLGGFLGRRDDDPPKCFERPEPVSRASKDWVETLAEKIATRLERRTNT